MGGDEGVRVMIAGVALARHRHEGLQFNLYGDETRIKAALDNHPNLRAASEVFHTDQVVAATDKPSQALRNSKKSSMGLAITAVKAGEAGAAVRSEEHTSELQSLMRISYAVFCLKKKKKKKNTNKSDHKKKIVRESQKQTETN